MNTSTLMEAHVQLVDLRKDPKWRKELNQKNGYIMYNHFPYMEVKHVRKAFTMRGNCGPLAVPFLGGDKDEVFTYLLDHTLKIPVEQHERKYRMFVVCSLNYHYDYVGFQLHDKDTGYMWDHLFIQGYQAMSEIFPEDILAMEDPMLFTKFYLAHLCKY